MGHSQADKQKTHDRIVEIASRRLREKGLNGVSVADLMSEADLTVGGFYKHFENKDDMVAEAMQVAFGAFRNRLREGGKRASEIPLSDYIETYLSKAHRDDPASGCPVAALSPDLARSGEKCRAVATDHIEASIDRLTERLKTNANATGAREKAVLASCLLVGVLGMSRIVNDRDLSDEILEVGKSYVRGVFSRTD